jgi:hypothetical protein
LEKTFVSYVNVIAVDLRFNAEPNPKMRVPALWDGDAFLTCLRHDGVCDRMLEARFCGGG